MSALCPTCGSGMDFWNAEGPYCVICENAELQMSIKETGKALRNMRDEYKVMYTSLLVEFPDSVPFEERAVVEVANSILGEDK